MEIVTLLFSIVGKAWDVWESSRKLAAAEADKVRLALQAADRQLDDALDALRAGLAKTDAEVDAMLAVERKRHEDDTVRLGPNPVPLVDPPKEE